MKGIGRWLFSGIVLLLVWLRPQAGAAAPLTQTADGQPLAIVLTVDGPITTAVQEYIARGLEIAARRQAEVVILQLNTPGGLLEPMLETASALRSSAVPVVVYVSPRGAWAASAGTVITLAAQAAAMAPETVIGAASPVGAQGEELSSTEAKKASEAIQALLRAYTERRGHEATALAEATVASARAVSANEALQAGLIDFIARDLDDLLRQLDGFVVQMADGKQTLHTAGIVVEELPMSFIETLLQILVNPNVVLILLGIGVQAILIELSSPGGWVAGFTGAVCLALAAYGLGFLPVNWFGALFILLAFVLFFLDVKAPTHGGLTAAGIGSFIAGALVLFNSPGTPQFQRVSVPLVVLMGLVLGLTFALLVGFALRAQKCPIQTGQEGLIGVQGFAVTPLEPHGQVQAAGELWSAQAIAGKIRKGERVEVVAVEGLRLKVRRLRQKG